MTAWNEERVGALLDLPCRAVCAAEEVSADGTTHFQIYIRFDQAVRFSWWKNQFPSFHVEPRKGQEWEAWQYICDVESYLKKEGAHPKTQGRIIVDRGCAKPGGKKNDSEVDQIQDMLERRCPRWQIYREHRRFYFWHGDKIRKLDDEMEGWVENGRSYIKDDE